jgi:hypothetical protein
MVDCNVLKLISFTGMLEKFSFSIYYGEGSVSHGRLGVDLSDFKGNVRGIDISRERSYQSICRWSMRELRVDSKTHVLSLQCVINRSPECSFWELMSINNIDDWIRYMGSALHWGWSFIMSVRVYVK